MRWAGRRRRLGNGSDGPARVGGSGPRRRRIQGAGDLLVDVAIELRARMARTILLIVAVALSTGALLASVGISQNAAQQVDADLAAATVNLVTVTPTANQGPDTGSSSGTDTGSSSSDSASSSGAASDGSNAPAGAPSGSAPSTGSSPTAGAASTAGSSPSAAANPTAGSTITLPDAAAGTGQPAIATVFPDDTEQRLLRIATVRAAGREILVSGSAPVRVDRAVAGISTQKINVTALTPGYLSAARIASTGKEQWMLDGTAHVAFLGLDAAKQLGVPQTADLQGVSVDINNVNYSIVGFLPGASTLSGNLVIPYRAGLDITRDDSQAQVLVRTAPGAGSQVSSVVRLAILPNAPERLAASQVASTAGLRQNVSAQLAKQATWVGAFLIVLTILLVANSMVVSVMARTTEIGVRRALGSSRKAVAAVFWAEGAVTGALGGLAGSAVAAVVIVTVAAVNEWTARLNPIWIALGPVLGTVVGLVASAYPALRASGIHPAIAVRSD